MPELPYLTQDLPGIGGQIKTRCEDFRVDEIPLYDPCGQGDHVYFTVAKTGVSSHQALERIARHMKTRPGNIGIAGLKDAQAVTTQRMSIEHADENRLRSFSDPQVQVYGITRHNNKLRTGHLAGNRFEIKIRGVDAQQLDQARKILDILGNRGVPNYFGKQRFGFRDDTALLGRALVADDAEQFCSILLGRPADSDSPEVQAARQAFDEGDWQSAMNAWPRRFRDERLALSTLVRTKNPKAVLSRIDKRMIRLYVSAFQSAVFNDILVHRLDSIDKVQAGDLAQKLDSGGVFLVEDAAVEQPRAEQFEISPTGPVFGSRSKLAQGLPGQIEQAVLDEYQLTQDDFKRIGKLKAKGTRRPLRFKIESCSLECGQDDAGSFLQLCFCAPSGCYATTVLREIMKTPE